MSMIPVIYEDGVFKPQCPVELPEHTRLVIDPGTAEPADGDEPTKRTMDRIQATLSRSVDTGISDLAARHNEHNP